MKRGAKAVAKSTKTKRETKTSGEVKTGPIAIVKVPPAETTLKVAAPDGLAMPLRTAAEALSMRVKALATTGLKDETSLGTANSLLVAIKTELNKSEEARKVLVKPLNDHIKFINARFKPNTDILEAADGILRQEIVTYREKLRAQTATEEAKLQAKAEVAIAKGDDAKALDLAAQAAQLERPDRVMTGDTGGTVAARQVWTFEVKALELVPREYFILDVVKIRTAISSGLRDIPGVRIFQQEILAVGGR